ncbi:peripheral-type benzodiazepine receptor-associated protein 1-like isoform X1 [Syngnathoides biaculeatus]|uniref:peripheral-type benzodiazepine receptor-associated protein 1-like isoform X1 n=1 Tax=Syngnathoides biaculeatus TaxID=300417 RepID=UPI002ADDE498|nr:peripheral-type benzodiazepine receptor-associated protein 1-like isoform X1 [Syngnathoides biaculeatus]XP_061672635.1 peripheral-type benzodiazepine receptor-associated protein 1-like isoform X1 [Syngnathoides biaculeatus]
MGSLGWPKSCRVEQLLKESQRDDVVSPRQSSPSAERSGQTPSTAKLRKEAAPPQVPSVQRLDDLGLPDNSGAALGLNPDILSSHRRKHSLLETEISAKRKECQALEAEVKRKNQTCQTLEDELQAIFQENPQLSLHFLNGSHKSSEYEKVKSEYAQLKDTLGAVTQERDFALWERNQLRGKLENLEQVLKCRAERSSDQEQ